MICKCIYAASSGGKLATLLGVTMRPHVVGRARWRTRQGRVMRPVILIPAFAAATLFADPANAVPAFAVQTGQPCQTCHIGAFGPQLTPFGRQFKINGYTLRAGDTFTPPVSGMAIASFE